MGKVQQVTTPAAAPSILYVLDTNVLIHDPAAILEFEEHHVIIPMTVLEELDNLKSGRQAIAADCRQAIRGIDDILGRASPDEIEQGIPIRRGDKGPCHGTLSILMTHAPDNLAILPTHLNDNKIINDICLLKHNPPNHRTVLVSKDINMRLKARGCGIDGEDYHNDQLVSEINLLDSGYFEFKGSFWEHIENVETEQQSGRTLHRIARQGPVADIYPNNFIVDEQGMVARAIEVTDDTVTLLHIDPSRFVQQEAWGLRPRDIYQSMALNLLLDPDIHLVSLTGSAGSGKTIMALAAAIEMTVATKMYRRIIVTRSTQGLDEDIGFLPGTEEEKMEPWLGAITDNLEALHYDDEDTEGSIDYLSLIHISEPTRLC